MPIHEPQDTAEENSALWGAIHAFHQHRDRGHAEAVMRALLRRIAEGGHLLFLGEVSESEEEGTFAIPGGIVRDGRMWMGCFTGRDRVGDSLANYPKGSLLGSEIGPFLDITLKSIAQGREEHRTTRAPDGRWQVKNPFPAIGLVIDPGPEPFYLTERMILKLAEENTALDEEDMAVLGC